MNIESQQEKISSFEHLELLANQVVEGFISGMHKSPFHGFSAEFAEQFWRKHQAHRLEAIRQNRPLIHQTF